MNERRTAFGILEKMRLFFCPFKLYFTRITTSPDNNSFLQNTSHERENQGSSRTRKFLSQINANINKRGKKKKTATAKCDTVTLSVCCNPSFNIVPMYCRSEQKHGVSTHVQRTYIQNLSFPSLQKILVKSSAVIPNIVPQNKHFLTAN